MLRERFFPQHGHSSGRNLLSPVGIEAKIYLSHGGHTLKSRKRERSDFRHQKACTGEIPASADVTAGRCRALRVPPRGSGALLGSLGSLLSGSRQMNHALAKVLYGTLPGVIAQGFSGALTTAISSWGS